MSFLSTRYFLAGVMIGGLILVGWGLAQQKDNPKSKVVEIDLNKLPPDLREKVLQNLRANDQTKPISLKQAITIAEKIGKGEAVKAERDGEGAEMEFEVEVIGAKGNRTRIKLNAQGKPLEAKNQGSHPGKGKGRNRRNKD